MKGFIITSIANNKTFFIIEVIHTTNGTIVMCMNENSELTRYAIIKEGAAQFKILPIEEQINAYNDIFYKYLEIPEHLKKYIQENTK